MSDTRGEITQLLADLQAGDKNAESRLAPMIYAELHRIAERYMRRERADHTLQATALVNEAYLRLVDQGKPWTSRVHFLAVAAKLMRSILVDYARGRGAVKRGGGNQKLSLDAVVLFSQNKTEQILALDQALSRLSEWDPRQSRIVELRFFAGLTEEEIGNLLGISTRTVKREWSLARAWLHSEIEG